MITAAKLRREAIPLLFFGSVVSIKLWFLYNVLVVEGGLEHMLRIWDAPRAAGGRLDYLLMDGFSYIAYSVTAILFDSLVFVSYLMRSEPREQARGFSETVFPLVTVLLPVLGFTLLSVPAARALVPQFNVGAWMQDYDLSPMFPILLDVTGLTIGLVGAGLSMIALWSLRRSFSLMSEVRELVSSGLYRRIRHPLYMSEIIHIFGVAILSGTPVGLALFGVALIMQIARARIEERKFLATVPEYAEFQARTGFLWPRLGAAENHR